jgi:hypothetical protein
MIGAFNSIYAALQGFLSRSFWFAAFLPIAIFASLHAALVYVVFGPSAFAGFKFDLAPSSAGKWSVIFLVLIVAAYVAQSLLPGLHGMLDGSLLPGWLHDLLRSRRLQKALNEQRKIKEAGDELGEISDVWTDVYKASGKLRSAYRSSEALKTALDSEAAQGAIDANGALAAALLSSAPLRAAVSRAETCVLAALGANNASPATLQKSISDPLQMKTAQLTGRAADDFETLIGRSRNEAQYRYDVLKTRNRLLGALDVARATSIGDARFVTERYVKDTYMVEFDYLWPRLMAAMNSEKTEGNLLQVIEQARTKVDFAALCLALGATVPLVWLPLIFYSGNRPWLFLTIGLATPPLLSFIFALLFESQLAVGAHVKTAVDRSRFLVLKMLRVPEPLSRAEERELWTRITNGEADPRSLDVYYAKSTASVVARP